MRLALFAIAGCASGAAAVDTRPASEAITRATWKVTSDPGIEIAVHEVAPRRPTLAPVLLVHGAGLGAASFDLPVAGYSLAEDLARAGHATYMLDIRGWGASTRPPELARDPIEHPPSVTSEQAVHDISAAVDEIRRRAGGKAVALVGWATGGHWAGMYAARHTAAVDRLVLLNTLYGTRAPWALNDALEDSPGRFSERIGAYSLRDGKSLIGRWEASIPGDDKDAWRDPRVAEAYVAAAIASDPTSRDRQPPTVRVPSGPLRDSHAAANGVMMWVASAIAAPVLVVRSARDFWSRPEDVAALQRDLHRSRDARFVTIPEATHFVFLDRPEHGRQMLVDQLLAFLAAK
jgi:pimeloyl-ACP methyl ester carboxylesterase